MSLSYEELKLISNATGINPPLWTIEEQLLMVYNEEQLNMSKIMEDIESCHLLINPEKECLDILSSSDHYSSDCRYSFYFTNDLFFQTIKLEEFMKTTALDVQIEQLEKNIAVRRILMYLVNKAKDYMLNEARQAHAEMWYDNNSFVLSCCVYDFVLKVLVQPNLCTFASRTWEEGFIRRFIDPLKVRLEKERFINH